MRCPECAINCLERTKKGDKCPNCDYSTIKKEKIIMIDDIEDMNEKNKRDEVAKDGM